MQWHFKISGPALCIHMSALLRDVRVPSMFFLLVAKTRDDGFDVLLHFHIDSLEISGGSQMLDINK